MFADVPHSAGEQHLVSCARSGASAPVLLARHPCYATTTCPRLGHHTDTSVACHEPTLGHSRVDRKCVLDGAGAGTTVRNQLDGDDDRRVPHYGQHLGRSFRRTALCCSGCRLRGAHTQKMSSLLTVWIWRVCQRGSRRAEYDFALGTRDPIFSLSHLPVGMSKRRLKMR